MDRRKDFYDILGVPQDAEQKVIKSMYKKMALEFHPDRNQNNLSAEEIFRKVQEAYEVLGDPQKRRLYDKYGSEGLKRGFTPPEQSTNDGVWHKYAGRWRDTYNQRAQRDQGIVLRGVDPDSDLLQIINGLKSKLQNAVSNKRYFDLKEIVIDLMGIYDIHKTESRQYDFLGSFGYGETLESTVNSIPENAYDTVFTSYDERTDRFFGGGFTVIEELLENRFQKREMRELEEVCRILGRDSQRMKEVLAVNTLDINVITNLQIETKMTHGMEFKQWNWNKETRRIADGRVDHYVILRQNLGEVIEIDLSGSESALVQRYLKMTLDVGRGPNCRPWVIESAAFYEDGFITTAAGVLFNRAISDRSKALIRYGNETSPQNYLSEALTNSKEDILGKLKSVLSGVYSPNALYDKKGDLRSLVDIIRRMAKIAKTKEAREVAKSAKAKKIRLCG